METHQLEKFIKNFNIPAYVVVLVYIPLGLIFSQIVITSTGLPYSTLAILGIYVLILPIFYKRYLFFILLIIFTFFSVYTLYYKFDDFREELIILLSFNLYMTVVSEVIYRIYKIKDLSQKNIELQNSLYEGLTYFITKSDKFTNEESIISELPPVFKIFAEELNIERILLFKDKTNNRGLNTNLVYEWCNNSECSPLDKSDFTELYYDFIGLQRWKDKFDKNESISGHSENLPEKEKDFLLDRGTQYFYSIPLLSSSDTSWGFLSFESMTITNRINDKDVKTIIQIFGKTLSTFLHSVSIEEENKKNLSEVEKTNELMINREEKILELKEKIKELKKEDKNE